LIDPEGVTKKEPFRTRLTIPEREDQKRICIKRRGSGGDAAEECPARVSEGGYTQREKSVRLIPLRRRKEKGTAGTAVGVGAGVACPRSMGDTRELGNPLGFPLRKKGIGEKPGTGDEAENQGKVRRLGKKLRSAAPASKLRERGGEGSSG